MKTAAANKNNNPRRRILLVDDKPEILDIFEAFLNIDGFEVLCATNYNDALAIFETQPIDLVVTDYSMPRIHGIILTDMVKTARPDVPVIMITAYKTDEMLANAHRRGADLVLEKPFEYEALYDAICKLLKLPNLN